MENQIKKLVLNWENYNEDDECIYLNCEDLKDVLKENSLITDEIKEIELIDSDIYAEHYNYRVYYVSTNTSAYLVRNHISIWGGPEYGLGIDKDHPRLIYICELSKDEIKRFEYRKESKIILKDFLKETFC